MGNGQEMICKIQVDFVYTKFLLNQSKIECEISRDFIVIKNYILKKYNFPDFVTLRKLQDLEICDNTNCDGCECAMEILVKHLNDM